MRLHENLHNGPLILREIEKTATFNKVAVISNVLAVGIMLTGMWLLFRPLPSINTEYVYPNLLSEPVSHRPEKEESLEVPVIGHTQQNIMYVYTEFCLNAPIKDATLHSSLTVSGVITKLPQSTISLPKGCHHASLPVNVPKEVKKGEYQLTANIEGNRAYVRKYKTNLYSSRVQIR